MLGLTLDLPADRPLRLLAIGAHSDDIEIGAGGTIMRLVAEHAGPGRPLGRPQRDRGASGRGARQRRTAAGGTHLPSIQVEAFRERYFPYLADLKSWFDNAGGDTPAPDVVIGPCAHDVHQDHRTVAELIRQTFRDQLVLEYEIPKFEGDLGHPNLYVELPPSVVDAKLAHLEEMFASQRSRSWFREELFRGLMALRGVEGGATSGYAEAFTAGKVRIGPPRA